MSITEINTCERGKPIMLSRPPQADIRGKGRPRKYTLEFLQSIPDLMIKDGLSLEQIAASVSGKTSTIIELCYRNRIQLPSRRRVRTYVSLKVSTIKQMQRQAKLRNITYNKLCELMLETIARDGMYKAILDD